MSIRWKIAAVCLLVVFVPIYWLNHRTIAFFDEFTRRALEEEMIHYTFMVGEEYRAVAKDRNLQSDFEERLRKYGEEFETRLQVVSTNGAILHDSQPGPAESGALDGRPEVRKAIGGRYGARTKLTPDRKFMYYHVALPVWDGDRVIAAACAMRHTGAITQAIRTLVERHRWALLLSLSLTAFLALLTASSLTRRLRRLTQAADDFARGDKALDISARGGDEIAVLAGAVGKMASEIERKNAYNRDFLAATSHELKTPLTAIKGAAEVLEQADAEPPSVRRKFLYNIRFETDRLIRMVEQLSELTRLDAEVLRGRKEKVDYAACLREILERIEPTFDPGHAPLSVLIPPDPISVLIVPGRIEQVVANLLENAFRYTPAGGVVEISVRRTGERTVVTTVRDTGCGIPRANLGRVFDRFFTTEPRDRVRDYGSGLGLSIAQSIVANHGGTLWVESEPGKGAAFFFTLPAAD